MGQSLAVETEKKGDLKEKLLREEGRVWTPAIKTEGAVQFLLGMVQHGAKAGSRSRSPILSLTPVLPPKPTVAVQGDKGQQVAGYAIVQVDLAEPYIPGGHNNVGMSQPCRVSEVPCPLHHRAQATQGDRTQEF